MTSSFSLQGRVVVFALYATLLWLVNYIHFGEPVPTAHWLLLSFVPLMLADLIVQPYFTAPSDSATNSIVAIITIFSLWGSKELTGASLQFWFIAFALFVFVVTMSVVAIWSGRSRKRRRLGDACKFLAAKMGSPKFIFTLIHFLILHSFHVETDEAIGLAFIWVTVVFGQPVEIVMSAIEKWRGTRRKAKVVGDVVLRQHPRLLTIQVAGEEHPDVDSLVIVPISNSSCQVGVVLDNYRLAEELWTKALIMKDEVPTEGIPEIDGPTNVALKCDEHIANQLFQNEPDYIESRTNVIGAVTENSDITMVRIELYRDRLPLTEGQIVSIIVGDKDVLYQVINGVTRSEELQKMNRHGYMQVEARKLGFRDAKEKSFEQVSWTPQIFSPVFKVARKEYEFRPEYIGCIPETEYGIKVSCKQLVTHNTAILGVLGSGKTTLAIELICRMVDAGIKVWIIDITGEYEKKLSGYVCQSKQKQADEMINNSIVTTEEYINQNPELGGNSGQFAEQIKDHIQRFLVDDTWRVRVFNPSNYRVTGQTSGVFNNKAGMGDLSPAQVTRIVVEQTLNCLKDEITDKAKLCLVLEEAHSLVPEWSSVATEGDKNATNGTTRALMQGRKYGFGCLLVTQRTANVSKSILSQCNMVFALQVFDETGMAFLRNYIGDVYANLLSALPSRHCVAYGRGINAKTPVIVHLNDEKAFSENFPTSRESDEPADT